MKIAHIINPVKVPRTSDLYMAQPITFESMRRARKMALKHDINIEIHYTCYEEDAGFVPNDFIPVGNLDRSVLDVGDFSRHRKLPLIKDILDRLYDKSDADYFIYTNVDISLNEGFYVEVAKIINHGCDAFVINRRTLSNKYTSISELDSMYSDKGEPHPGFDCFVFKREVYPRFDLGCVCIGANWIGRALISNLIVNSNKFKVFDDKFLTFHIGDDRSWKVKKYSDYDLHNQKIVLSFLRKTEQDGLLDKSALLGQFKDQFETFEEEERARSICESNALYNYIDKNNNAVNQSPVFIVGFPRSGTTLLQSLVATQNIYTFPETHYFNLVLSSIKTDGDKVDDDYVKIVSSIEERYPLSDEAKDCVWLTLRKRNLDIKKLFEILVIDGLLKQGVLESDLSSVRWLEKTPSHAFKLQQISRYYPQAKFIYILRNPLDTFSSWRRVSHGWGQDAQPVEEYADLWLKLLRAAERFNKKTPSNLKFIRLEDLVDDVANIMEDLMLFLGNGFNVSALDNRTKGNNAYILPDEKWKIEGANQDISKSTSIGHGDQLSLQEKVQAECALSVYMSRYDYELKYYSGGSAGVNTYWRRMQGLKSLILEYISCHYDLVLRLFSAKSVRLYACFKKAFAKIVNIISK